MAEHVQSGDKILASQYNALVDALAGPTNAVTDQPFTQTKNGIVINGGLGRQTTKAASTVPSMFEVSYGDGYVGDGYSTYQRGDVDANRFNGVFLNVGNADALMYNGFVFGNGVALPTIPVFAIIDPTNNSAGLVVYNRALAATTAKGKLPLCKADEDAGYAFVQIIDNGSAGKDLNGSFVLLVGDFTKIGSSLGSDIKRVSPDNLIRTLRGINLYENCLDARVVQCGVLWSHNIISGVVGPTIPHLSYTVGTQYVDMLPDSYVDYDNAILSGQTVWATGTMPLKLRSIGIVPRQQMGFSGLNPTNTFELYHFDKLSSDISCLREIGEDGLSAYDVLLKHKQPHPKTEDDPDYEGQAEADLQYISLSGLLDGYVGDSQLPYLNLSSVVKRKDDGQRYFGLYGFETSSYNRTLNVRLSYGATTYVVQSGSGTDAPDHRVQFITRDANGSPFVSYDNIAVTAPRISTSDVDGIETILSGVVTYVSVDLSVLSGDISDLSSQLSNYWKIGGTYDDNCYGQSIGDASKKLAISLDNRALYAKNGSAALRWNRRVAYDGNENPAINWSDNGQYGDRCLIHRQGMPVVDWLNMNLMGRANGTTVAWEDRSLKGAWTVDQGTNPGGAASLAVNGPLSAASAAVKGQLRAGSLTVNGQLTTGTLKIGNTTLNETQLQQLLALLNP